MRTALPGMLNQTLLGETSANSVSRASIIADGFEGHNEARPRPSLYGAAARARHMVSTS